MSGSSTGERHCWRTQPQFRPDCSPAMRPFSKSATDTPLRARKYAVELPMIPPPMIATSAAAGSGLSRGVPGELVRRARMDLRLARHQRASLR